MSVQTAYNEWSVTYDTDENLTRDLDQVVTRETLAQLRPASILEIGCGTGKNTVFLAELAEHVQALDFSAGMLAQAKAKVTQPNVTFGVADLTQPWPCATHSVDLVVCNLVLEHIEDLAHIFAEAARVLRPDGHFFVCELHPFKQYLGLKANFQRADTRTEIPAFVHHISDFVAAATTAGLTLTALKEWWHERDVDKPPRLVSFMFKQ